MRALISVYDKSGLLDFLGECGSSIDEIYATGSTGEYLKKNGLSAKSTSEITGFEQLLGGRVKTLHPMIFAGILSDETARSAREKDYLDFDLVICNFYPFRAVSGGSDTGKMIENIDIGGVSLVRAAAKNYHNVIVLSDPSDYGMVSESIRNSGVVPENMREKLAVRSFQRVSDYDILIYNSLFRVFEGGIPDSLLISGINGQKLRYGENPDQRGYLYSDGSGSGIANAKKISGKELSYNNLMDSDSAYSTVMEFDDPACVIVKHNTPCGAAVGKNILEAFEMALETDKESAYGSVIAFNRQVDGSTASALSHLFVEVIVAPGYSESSLEILVKKKNLRIIEAKPGTIKGLRVRSISGGYLLQDELTSRFDKSDLKTSRKASDDQVDDLIFAWKIVTHCRSNAIVLARNGSTVAIGAGQTSRVEALRIAIAKAGQRCIGSVMASDAFFPFSDSVELAGANGIAAIIQPGGSIRDSEVIAMAEEKNIPMYFTGKRVFLH
ncbi:MAG: bifunctional phosphoribosylaminoimidazolecarboxamide formyltransferase/IMP cyclohydrolase [Thermoplasmatales archaeon B_DKE]|nr:MAG: bifunctional phosphoribosylaminoimidazolecarboxamide formyltransferase/IMP cyclohydrolase [Thermoplasmatales archaeon B_DKE]QRF75767.1 bifunctional phosphoribosylaminoimidazolecarboxamide formyltransferase/IMP cyclohydrolase [Thermoplasmatales archaeon]